MSPCFFALKHSIKWLLIRGPADTSTYSNPSSSDPGLCLSFCYSLSSLPPAFLIIPFFLLLHHSGDWEILSLLVGTILSQPLSKGPLTHHLQPGYLPYFLSLPICPFCLFLSGFKSLTPFPLSLDRHAFSISLRSYWGMCVSLSCMWIPTAVGGKPCGFCRHEKEERESQVFSASPYNGIWFREDYFLKLEQLSV